MSREWQQTRFHEYVMPDAVYYEAIWAVRDFPRMEKRLEILRGEKADEEGSRVSEATQPYSTVNENYVRERKILEERVQAIYQAIEEVPPMYRTVVLDNIIKKTTENSFPSKLWRVWKQRFLYRVARNLELM